MDILLESLNKLSSSEMDDILDKRDSDHFDLAWCNLNDITPATNRPLIAKDTFITLSGITNAHELCSYISDDLELIARADNAGVESDFLNYLKTSYEQGEIPCEWHN